MAIIVLARDGRIPCASRGDVDADHLLQRTWRWQCRSHLPRAATRAPGFSQGFGEGRCVRRAAAPCRPIRPSRAGNGPTGREQAGYAAFRSAIADRALPESETSAMTSRGAPSSTGAPQTGETMRYPASPSQVPSKSRIRSSGSTTTMGPFWCTGFLGGRGTPCGGRARRRNRHCSRGSRPQYAGKLLRGDN